MSIGERPWFLFLLLPFLLILSLSDISAATPDPSPQVIILSSYHYGYAWSDNELTGVLTRLRQDYPEIAPFIEYLDAKRFAGPDQLERMRDYLAGKYRGKRIDLVIALDNPALEMATQYQQEVFPGVPLVFAGINNFTPAMLRGRKKVTGVAEVEDIAGTLELALTLHPHTREVVVIHDYTTSGLAFYRDMEAAAPQFQNRVQFRFLPRSTFEEVVGQLQSLPANSLGLITAFTTDREGRVLSPAASTRLFAASMAFPLYGTHDTRLGHGIVGGSLLSGADQGKRAGEMALRVLAGEDPDRLPVDTAGPHRLMFDYRQLTRFGIPLAALPAESMVINRPESFYEQYKYLTLAVSWVFAFLLLTVGILALTIVRRRRAERRLRDSEERYRSLVENSFDWIWEVDAQVRYIYASPRVVDFLGYTPEEMLGRTPFEFMPEAEARRVGEIFGTIAAARRPFTALENVNLHRDGRRVVLETSGAPIFGSDGEFKGYRGSDRDITARQAAEQALQESEERLRLANEAANIGTLDVDLEAGWARLSPELCAILGVPSGREWNIHEGIEIVHPEDRDLVIAASRRSQDPAGDGRIYSELRIIRPDGEVRWLVWSGRTIFRDTPAGRVPCRGISVVFDITERKRTEAEIKLSEARLASLLRISHYSPTSSQGLLDYALEEAIALTGSKIGYIYFYDETTQQFTLNTWSKEVMQVCAVAERQTIYQLEKTGIWGEAVRQARPIMVNDFQAPHPLKKGCPEGHAPLYKYLTLPVISDNRIVAVVGVANKDTDYDDADVRQLTLMMDAVWKIVERQRAEEDLRKSEERYRLLVDQIPAMVFKGYGDWSIDPLDEKVEALTGYSKEDFESRRLKWCDLIPAEDLDYATRVFIEALKTDKSYVREHRLRKKDGEIIWVQCRGQIFCNDQGKVDYISGVSFDVTERRRAQEALKERERFLADIFDSIQDGISILDTDFNILRVNQAMELWFPHALPLAGKKCYAAYRQRSAPCEGCPSRETLETGKAGHAAFMTKIGPDGEAARWLEVYTFPMLEIGSGKVRGIIQYLRDITKRKQAEEALQESEKRYQSMFEDSPISLWQEDFSEVNAYLQTLRNQGVQDIRAYLARHPGTVAHCANLVKLLDVNKATLKIYEAESKEELFQGLRYVIADESYQVFQQIIIALAEGRTVFEGEGLTQTLKGNKLHIITRLSVIPGFEQTLTRVLVSIIDITERKQAEEALRQSEGEYRLLVNQIPAVVFKGYADWSVDFFDNKIEALTGYSKEEFDSRQIKWCELILPEDLEQAKSRLIKGIKTGGAYGREYRIRKKDGGVAWIQAMGQIFCNAEGKLDYVSGVFFDITARKQTEEELIRAKEEWELTFNSIPLLIAILDTRYRIVRVNLPMAAKLGVTTEEAVGRKCYEIVHKTAAPPEFCAHAKLLADGSEHTVEIFDENLGGYFGVSTSPLRDSRGNLLGSVHIAHDITNRKRAEESLRQSEARLAEAQRIAQVGCWEWNIKTNQAVWSEELFRIFHLPPQEYGPNYEEFLQYVYPDDRESLKQSLAKGLASGKPFDADYRIILGDGSRRHVHLHAQIILDESGEPALMRGIAQDITERVLAEQKLRESNERFAAVFENAALGISVTDAQGRILATNPCFQEMLGYHAAELLSKTFPEITHPEDLAKNLELFQEMMTGQSQGFQLEKRYLRKNGENFWARVTVSSIKETKGQPPYNIAVVEEITLRKQTQEKLKDSERNLRYLAAQLLTAQERERQRISRDLHDDLGQSLIALKLQLQAIEREEPANLTVLRQKLATQTAFIDDIVNNIRRLCMDLHPTTLDVLGLIVALKRLFKEFSALYGIKFSLDLDDVRDLLSPQAQIIIYRIFQESLTNIAKYAQATRATVTIKRENDTVFFTVQDNGKGFNLEQVRSRSVRKRGLGLAAMEERVRMLGGTLEMQSQKGVGTRISFKIPVSLLRHANVDN